MSETHKIHDPFLGKDVEISSKLTDRLRGKYANGPTMPNGQPEFGWREFQTPPIQHEAAKVIEHLSIQLAEARAQVEKQRSCIDWISTWVNQPVGAFSVAALDGLFGMARDRIASLTPHVRQPE